VGKSRKADGKMNATLSKGKKRRVNAKAVKCAKGGERGCKKVKEHLRRKRVSLSKLAQKWGQREGNKQKRKKKKKDRGGTRGAAGNPKETAHDVHLEKKRGKNRGSQDTSTKTAWHKELS